MRIDFRPGPLVVTACWTTFLLDVIVWASLRLADSWALPSLLSYGPRWVWAVPPVVLLPLTFKHGRRCAAPLTVALAVALAGIMPLELPWTRRPAGGHGELTVLTLNAGYKADPGVVQALVQRTGAEIVTLQEWARAAEEPFEGNFSMHCEGGLCIASRYPVEPLEALRRTGDGANHFMAFRARVRTPGGPLTVAVVHLETVRKGIEPVLRRPQLGLSPLHANIIARNAESARVAAWLDRPPQPAIIAGDFNLPMDSAIYQRHWSRWTNAFAAAGFGYGHTKITRWWGLRIDHILVNEGTFAVARSWTGPAVGSDHRPLLAVLRLE